jgi:hypothetical protein
MLISVVMPYYHVGVSVHFGVFYHVAAVFLFGTC